jgi:excisionase family DNA binding protein
MSFDIPARARGDLFSMTPALLPRLALSPDEAAAALGVSRDYLDKHISPELRWVRRGRRKLVAVSELERWLDRNGALTLEAS